MDPNTELAELRRIVAEWITDSYADPAGATGPSAAAIAAIGHAATALHERIAEAGIDLSPELDAIADGAAAHAFDQART